MWNSTLGGARKKLATVSEIPLKASNINVYPRGLIDMPLLSKPVPKETYGVSFSQGVLLSHGEASPFPQSL